MHDELTTLETALPRLAHDTLVHLVRKPGALRMVRVAVPATWDTEAVVAGLQALFAKRGWTGVDVVVLPTEGDPRLLSVMT